ncbi:HK97 gp10 family phage protein [Psychrobacter sp. I-STPA6b]|uniref:HK97 gp10 family phage protein n=1 Tax=Psychrobacter sp. I-STPA6b TaxID=2585718 RepID=UPI001D0C8C8E|nr:HK97 gp10 family phage protein [Psychrobacter sp. I-STPA6b]
MSNNTFALDISRFTENTIRDIKKLRKEVQKELAGSIISDTPVDTGLARSNWIASKDAPANYSMPLATSSGNPVAEAQSKAFGEDGKFYLVNNVDYVYYLEFGHSSQAPQGMARKNMQRVTDNLRAQYG